jgi:type IV secretion system protein VirB11
VSRAGSPAHGQVYLASFLAPLQRYLAQPDVTDIFVNRPGEVWVERLGALPERIDAPDLTADNLVRLVQQLAAISAQGISREHPLLAANLPGGERVQVAIPPATRGDIAIAIRKHVISGLSLDDYSDAGAFALTRTETGEQGAPPGAALDLTADPVALLRRAVRERRNILVSGGTASGKTTLLNALLREVPREERLILIEDTPELQIEHANAVGLVAARGGLGEAQITTEDLVIAALRMRPDRIILGEIRGGEAVSFLRAVNTGHPGSLSSVHADSPTRAIDLIALLVMQLGTRMAWDDVVQYVRRSLDLIVQLQYRAGRRTIECIHALH